MLHASGGAKVRGQRSIAAFGADLQATRRNQYGFDSLQFDPHASLANRNETFYARYRRYYDENRWYNSHVNAIKESLVEFGLDLETDDEGKRRVWEEWRDATGFDALYANMLATKYALGNSYGSIVPAGVLDIDDPAAKGWAIQILTTEYCYNVGDASGRLRAFYHDRNAGGVWRSFAEEEIPTASKGPWIMPADMFYLSYDRLGNDLYARPLASTAGEAFDDMGVLQATRNALAKNSAYGFLHADVDVSHVTPGNDTTKAVSLEEQYLDGVSGQLSEVEQYDIATGKMRVLNRMITKSRWDADKKQKLGLVTLSAIDTKADFAGLVQVIDQLWDELSMVLRVPQVFMGRKEGSNRAQSVTEYLAYSQFLDSQILADYREIETKIFPLIGLEGERLKHDARVPSQDLVRAQIADIVGRLPQLRDDEKRDLLGDLFGVEFTGAAPPPPPVAPAGPGFGSQGARMDNAQRERAAMAKAPMTHSEQAFREGWDFNPVKTLAQYRLALDAEVIAMADGMLRQAHEVMDGKSNEPQTSEAKHAKFAAGAPPDQIKRLADVKPDISRFQSLLDEFNRQLYFEARKDILGLDELPADFKFNDTRGLDKLLAVNQMHAEDAISPVGAEARKALVDALSKGQSVDDAADAVRKAFDDYDTDRLVRTELNRAGNAGTLDAYRETYVSEKVRWMTSMDDLVDPDCRALEAEYAAGITIDEAEAMGVPPEHPNCRCRWVPVSEWDFVTGA